MSNLLRSWIEQKGGRRMNLHSVWAKIYSSSCTQTVAPLIFGHLNSDLDLHCWFLLVPQFSGLHTQIVISLPFLVFHPLDSRSWDSSVFKTMWTNSYKFFTIYSLLIVFLENSEIIMFYCFFFLFLLMQCIDVSFLL